MKGQQLKNSILQYALQGKLVEQDSNEEPASLLFERIEKEKGQLIKDKVIKLEKKTSSFFEEEMPYDIPRSWKWVRLKEICIFNPKNKTEDDTKVGFVPMKLINEGFSNYHSYENKNWKEIKKGYTHFQNDDIAIAKITPCFENKKSVIIKDLPNGVGAGTTELFIIRPFTRYIEPKYLLYLFKNQSFINEGVKSFTGTAGQQRVSRVFLENYVFGLPPFAEQQRIVTKIEELFEKVDEYDVLEREITELNDSFPTNMEKSILQFAMQGKLVEQNRNDESASQLLEKIGEEKEQLIKEKVIKRGKVLLPITDEEFPFEIPKSWEWVRLIQVGYIISGGTPKTGEPTYWKEDGILWVTPSDMGKNKQMFIANSQRRISKLGLDKSSAQLIPKDSIIYSSRAPIGHINIVEDDYTTNQGCKSVVPMIYNKFLYYSLIWSTPDINKRASGTTFKEISGTEFGLTVIPLPPIAEQYRIVERIEMMNKLTVKMKNILNFG